MIYNKSAVVAAIFIVLLSQIQVEAAKTSKAKKNNTNYTQKQINKAISLLNTARKQVEKGKMQDAINSYWKVLEIDPTQSYAYLELGELYKNLRIYDRAIEMLTSGLELASNELDGNTICNYNCILVEVYSITDQQGLANKALIKAAEAAPRNPMPRKILGDIYLKNNRIANAYKAYKKSLELDPYYQPAIDAMASLKQEYGDKLPQEDKDSEYIKKVAVKLVDSKSKSSSQNISTEPSIDQQTIPATSDNSESAQLIITKNDLKETQVSLTKTSLETKTKTGRPTPMPLEDMPNVTPKKTNKKQEINKGHNISSLDETEENSNIKENNNTFKYVNISEADNEIIQNDNSINDYIDKLLEGNYTEKEEAISSLVKSGNSGLKAVEELLFDDNPEVRILAVKTLPRFEEYHNDVKTMLQDAIDDSDEDVAEAVKQALESL